MKAVTEMFKLFVNDREVIYDICELKFMVLLMFALHDKCK